MHKIVCSQYGPATRMCRAVIGERRFCMGRVVGVVSIMLCFLLAPIGAQGQEEGQETPATAYFLDVPYQGGQYSGVGTVHGWICEPMGDLTVRFDDGEPIPLLYGAQRADVMEAGQCDHAEVGFVTIWNWGELGEGEHTARVYDGDMLLVEHTFMVATFGVPFLTDAEGSCTIADFPSTGETAHFTWTQGTQHLELDPSEDTDGEAGEEEDGSEDMDDMG